MILQWEYNELTCYGDNFLVWTKAWQNPVRVGLILELCATGYVIMHDMT